MNPDSTTPALAVPDPQTLEALPRAETFWGVLFRRTRYLAAIALSATIFLTLGWMLVAPPAEFAGISLLLWTQAGGLAQAAGIAALLTAAIFLAMLLCHPDSPHAAMYCALLGMAGLAIRGGDVTLILINGQRTNTLPSIFKLFALECFQWALLVLLAEGVTHFLFAKLFRNTRWIERMGLPLDALGLFPGSLPQAAPETKAPRARFLNDLIALVLTSAAAFLLLRIFMQSDSKGQVLFAIFAAFGIATFAVRMKFSKTDTWPFWLAVPLTAGIGYFLASRNAVPVSYVPGIISDFIPRALPIDYIAAGVPGAILGYASALRMQLHQHLTDHADA